MDINNTSRVPDTKRTTAYLRKPDVEKGSWRAGAPEQSTAPAPLPDLPMKVEDPNVDLFAELVSAGDHDVVLLDHHTVGLVVDGELRATYVREAVYGRGSALGKARLAKAAREAAALERTALGYGRTTRSAVAVRRSVESEPAEGIIQEVEAKGIESFIGPILDATSAERANIRDRRPVGRDLLGMIPEPERVIVDGNE